MWCVNKCVCGGVCTIVRGCIGYMCVICGVCVCVKGMCVLGHDEERKKDKYCYLVQDMPTHVVQCRKNTDHSL